MPALYHWEPVGACGRVLIALHEKDIDYQSHYLDVLAFEQHNPEFIQLNASGEVPVLVVDGEAMNESSYICEYLEEAYPQNSLMPEQPLDRWAVRVWQKYVDDYVAACASDLAWMALEHNNFKQRDSAVTSKAIAAIPLRERRDAWQEAAAGYDADRLQRARERMAELIKKLEQDLALSEWLVPGGYSLADIAVFPYANYLPRVLPDLVNDEKAPNTMAWLVRMQQRPAVRAALATAKRKDPYAAAAPGPEHVRWG